MRSIYFFIFIIMMSLFIVGCSNTNGVSLEDGKIGYVKEIKTNQLLIVLSENKEEVLDSSMAELTEKDIESIWLTATNKQIENIEIGDKVLYTTKGPIDTSSPAKGTAKNIKVIN